MTSTDASILTPSSLSTSAEPVLLVMLRFPCLATAIPDPTATMAAAVEMLKVPEPSPPVPQVSTRSSREDSKTVMCLRMAPAAPAISATVSPLATSASRNARISSSAQMPCITRSIVSAISCWDKLVPVSMCVIVSVSMG